MGLHCNCSNYSCNGQEFTSWFLCIFTVGKKTDLLHWDFDLLFGIMYVYFMEWNTFIHIFSLKVFKMGSIILIFYKEHIENKKWKKVNYMVILFCILSWLFYSVYFLLELRFLYYSFVRLSRLIRMTILVVPLKHTLLVSLSIHWYYYGSRLSCPHTRFEDWGLAEEVACWSGYTHTPKLCHRIL